MASTCTFDQWLFALRIGVETANDALRLRRARQLHLANAGGENLHVEIPRGPADDAPLDPVVIPLRWFRDWRVPQVTEFSVEFECQLHYVKSRGAPAELVIDMRPPGKRWWRRQRSHHMRIAFRAADAWKPSISLDGRQAHAPLAEIR
jgi:hypothetical protein